MRRSTCLLVSVLFACSVAAQDEDRASEPRRAQSSAWFGVPLPTGSSAEPAVIVGPRAPRPVVLPPDEPAHPELRADSIRRDLETIVGYSTRSRTQREIGSGQLWGRITGFPSSATTIDWAATQLRAAGITNVMTQAFKQEEGSSLWLPLSWEVRLLGDPAFGAGSTDIVLQSAMPLQPSSLPQGGLAAPLVYVGTANPSVIEHIDVKGKIAVQLSIPQGHMVFERSAVTPRAQALMKRGAVAVLNLVRLPGNEPARDFSNCGGPCFNLGGRDGWFVENVLDRATQAGLNGKIRARLTLTTETRTALAGRNVVAVVPGTRADESIVIDAHADAWFDGAGDNADGLAVTLALARHFAKAANRPARTLAFVVSAGHHTPGMNGPRNFVAANPELAKQAVLVLNVEHVAQRNFSPARSVGADGYRQAVADSGEAPITIGVSNSSPFLNELIERGSVRYGTNFVSQPSSMQSGETGGFSAINASRITVMQAPPLYHTTGETLEVISTPGLERMARFLAYFIDGVAKAPREKINP